MDGNALKAVLAAGIHAVNNVVWKLW